MKLQFLRFFTVSVLVKKGYFLMFVVDFQKCRVLNVKFDLLSVILKFMFLSTISVDEISVNKGFHRPIFIISLQRELEKLLNKTNL